MKRSTAVVLALAVLAGPGTGCTTLTGRSLGTNIDDKTTAAAVKARLSAHDARHLTWVDVDTKSGVVYLTGNVASPPERQQAEDLARSVAGVRDVVNNLHVSGTGAAAQGARTADRPTPASRATASPAASPAAKVPTATQRLIGEVAKVDRETGRVSVRTTDGDLTLQLPPATAGRLREGDRVTVDIAIAPAR